MNYELKAFLCLCIDIFFLFSVFSVEFFKSSVFISGGKEREEHLRREFVRKKRKTVGNEIHFEEEEEGRMKRKESTLT